MTRMSARSGGIRTQAFATLALFVFCPPVYGQDPPTPDSGDDIVIHETDTVLLVGTANDQRTASNTVEVTMRNHNQSFDDTTPRMIATPGTDVDLQSLKILSETYQGLEASFEWTQLSGPAVNMLGTTSESARFTAPEVQEQATLVFRLVAEYEKGITMSDTIPITIVPKRVERVLSALADFNDIDPAQRPFTRQDIVNLLDQNADSLKNFISQSSRNLVHMDFDVLDWITVDKNTTDYPLGEGSVVSDVVSAMSNFADLGQYDKVLPLIFPLEQGYPGCQAFLDPVNWNTVNGNFLLGAAWLSGRNMSCVRKGRIAHEVGHTFGFLHSYELDCAKEPPIPISTIDPTDMNDSCLHYGLPFGSTDPETLFPVDAGIIVNKDLDMMGGDHTQRYEDLFPLHYQGIWQALAGWLLESQVIVPDESGEYWLTTLESLTPTPKVMRISLGDDHELSPQYYWLQTREFSPCEVDVKLQANHIFNGLDQLDPSQVGKFQDGQAHSYFASYHDLIKPEGEAVQQFDVDSKVFLNKPFWDPYRRIHIAMLGCEEGDLANATRLEVTFSPLTIYPPLAVSLINTTAPIRLTNGGKVPIDINTASIGGRHPDAFAIDSDQCSNSSLSPYASCEIVVSSTPTNPFDLAVLKIPNSDSIAPEIAVSLISGAGVTFPSSDGDMDGVDDGVENEAPNGGDANQDGTADSEQSHVASLHSSVTGEYVSLVSAPGTSLVAVRAVENPSPGDLPPGVVFPLGLFQFSVQGLAPGAATSVELLLPNGLEIDTYYKFGPTPSNGTDHWYDFVWDELTGVEISEGKLDLHFIDGSRGDDDLSANGTVMEPGGPAQVLGSFFFPQFADGTIANIQLLSTLVLANAGADSAVQVEFFSSPDGGPMELTLGELGTDSRFEFDLREGESISLQTPGTGNLQVGYGRVFAEPDVGGVVVFARRDLANDITLVEAGVPASSQLTEFSVVVDSLEDRDTGLALVYPAEQGSPDANVTVRLYDQGFNLIGERTLDPMEPGSHFALFVSELFQDGDVIAQAQEMEGLLTVESDQPLVAVTLRQNDAPGQDFPEEVPTLTTFPVIPGRPGQ